MERVFTDIVEYDEILKSEGIRLEDLQFVNKNIALISKLGEQDPSFEELDFGANYTQLFDLTKPYEIHTEELFQVTELRYNIDKETGAYESFRGSDAEEPFLQLLSMIRTYGKTKDNPEGTKSRVTDFKNASRK